MCGLVVVAAVIRFLVIDTQSYWADEALTAYEARLPFGSMLNVVLHVETTPPLYFVLIWVWGHVFGTGAVALRAVSTLAGIAVVPISLSVRAGARVAARRGDRGGARDRQPVPHLVLAGGAGLHAAGRAERRLVSVLPACAP